MYLRSRAGLVELWESLNEEKKQSFIADINNLFDVESEKTGKKGRDIYYSAYTVGSTCSPTTAKSFGLVKTLRAKYHDYRKPD